MKDQSYIFQGEMLEDGQQPSEDCTFPQEYTAIPDITGMTSSPSDFTCSPLSISKQHTGGDRTSVVTTREARQGHNIIFNNLSKPAPSPNNYDDDDDNCFITSSPSQRGLYSHATTTKLKSSTGCFSFSTLVSSSSVIMSSLHIKSSSSTTKTILLCLLVTFLACPSSAFNLDLKTAVVHEGSKGSMFGYSVAQHVDQSTHWLLIGAPKAQTRQPNIDKAGAVYRCKTDGVNSCQQVPFDPKGNNIKYDRTIQDYVPIEEKSNQWFGATLQSSGESGVIVACAPRYIYFGSDNKKREPVGMCWVAKTSTTEYESYTPCAKGKGGFERQGFCQAGFSAALSDDGRRLMIAAPGSWYWQGQLYNFNTDEKGRVFAKTPEGNASQDNTYKGQMFVYDAETGKPRYTNKEGDTDTDYGYRGYSSAMGKFDGDDEFDYVVGIPKGDDYVGMIEIYTQNMTLLGSISGEQVGAYFGGAVAVTDLNGDRLDDIIVGAPFFTNFQLSDSWETGRVYVYYQTSAHTFKANQFDILDGASTKSRFGIALAALGDIDYNGFMDLCVGAPYAGEDQKGAIYIYMGSSAGIITDYSQVIYASDFKSPLVSFGSSISAGTDQDGNYYPDVLVGAYESDKAVFMRSRPVVNVVLKFVLTPRKINLDVKDCKLNGTKVPCLEVHTCIYYDGLGVPENLFFDLKWHIDAKEDNSSNAEQRAFFKRGQPILEWKAYNITKKVTNCTSLHAYVKPDLSDKFSPLKAVINFELNLEEEEKRSRVKRDLQPILNASVQKHAFFTVRIQNNCGDNNICTPDLGVTYMFLDRDHHIAGDSTQLKVLIRVGNKGEEAFDSKLFIEMPPGVDYIGIEEIKSEVTISCDPLDGTQFVICNLGNPMTNKSMSQFTFKAKPPSARNTKDSLRFSLHVNSSNLEATTTYKDNQVQFDIDVTMNLKIDFVGAAIPRKVNASVANKQDDGQGKLIRHKFVLKNLGVSIINETELIIHWPSSDRGLPALVLDGDLIIEGSGTCKKKSITSANPLDYGTYQNEGYPVGVRRKKTRDIRCTYLSCTIINCTVGFTTEDPEFTLTINSRLKVKHFLDNRRDLEDEDLVEMYNLTSIAEATVKSVPYDIKKVDLSKIKIKRFMIKTYLNTVDEEGSGGIAPWIYAVAISVGILLLLILILLLWCCGFFKRKKPDTDEGYFAVNGKNDIDNKYVD